MDNMDSKVTSRILRIGKSVTRLLLAASLGFSVPAFATELVLEWGSSGPVRGWHDLNINTEGPFAIFTSDVFAQEEPVPIEVLVSPLSGGPSVPLSPVTYFGATQETAYNAETDAYDDVGYYHTYLVNIAPFCSSQPVREIFQVRFRVLGTRNVSERRLMTCGG